MLRRYLPRELNFIVERQHGLHTPNSIPQHGSVRSNLTRKHMNIQFTWRFSKLAQQTFSEKKQSQQTYTISKEKGRVSTPNIDICSLKKKNIDICSNDICSIF